MPADVIGHLTGYAAAAVTAGQVLGGLTAPCFCQVGGVQANAGTAGTGAGSTVLDLQLNGRSVWADATRRPTLAATATGSFNVQRPALAALKPGDVLKLVVLSVSSTGHADLSAGVAIERATT